MYGKEISDVLEHVKQLDQLDVENVRPTYQVIDDMSNRYRKDEIRPSLTQAEAISSAKQTHQGFIVVNRVLSHDEA